MRHSVE